MTLMFLNGGAMRGGPLHHLLAGARFVGAVRTAPRYRFYSVGDRFPALAELTGPQEMGAGLDAGAGAGLGAGAGVGVSVAGELYEVPWEVLRESLLPAEPAELELGVIELEDGSGCLSMIRRRTYQEPPGLYRDISDHADWRSYTAMPAPAGSTEE
ncbi:MAG TPA: gamma-glutamylcyclotransferase [Actinocrinis sp.]|uniref:allophanate hydrolase-related protein n=1 Tax=Actinocrinis sp. TaxID=1920516 RepID=UPI002D488E49|nr:gamma-glutamylcyclotransferase [Actinocrinis sp.]HZU56866.1 gamma-glutamylcyclotransferase [Actinocrinis sp.]